MLHDEHSRGVTISGDGAWGENRSSIDGARAGGHIVGNEMYTRSRLEVLYSTEVNVCDVALFGLPF